MSGPATEKARLPNCVLLRLTAAARVLEERSWRTFESDVICEQLFLSSSMGMTVINMMLLKLLAIAKFLVLTVVIELLTGSARRVVHGEIGCSMWKKTLAYLLVLPGSRARIVRCGGRYDPQLVKRSSA